jgi:hypothetical protein
MSPHPALLLPPHGIFIKNIKASLPSLYVMVRREPFSVTDDTYVLRDLFTNAHKAGIACNRPLGADG